MGEKRPPTYGGWEQLVETPQIYEAELIAGRLRDAGLDVEILDQTFRQEPVPVMRSLSLVRVLVPKDRVAEARELLESMQLESEDAPPER